MKRLFLIVFALPVLLAAFLCLSHAAEIPETQEGSECTHEYVYTSAGDGTHTALCAKCGDTFTETCDYIHTTVLPTGTEQGYTDHKCGKCGYSYRDAVLPAENTRPQSSLVGDADLDGELTAADARAILRAVISLQGLKSGALPYADADGDGLLTSADARLALRFAVGLQKTQTRHEYKVTVLKAPDCTGDGRVSFRCTYCGKTGELTAPANGHVFGNAVEVPADCTKNGSSTRTCSVCGYRSVTTLLKKTHAWSVSGEIVKCSSCGTKAQGIVQAGKASYYCENGIKQKSWCKIGDAYYFFDRTTGKMAVNTVVDGLKVRKDGRAAADAYTTEKIRTFIKAKNIVASITEPTDTVAEKKLKAFRWVMKWPYHQYRGVGEAMQTPGFEMLFANDIFDNHNGCCGSTSYAFAFLAVECGCSEVYVADDGVSRGGHAWVVMEGNNRVYDVIFAKAKSFSKNYDYATSDYRRNAPRKTYIGG